MKMQFFNGTSSNWPSKVLLIVISCLIVNTALGAGQKKGFRGGDKGYGIIVQANSIGTNLQYKLPQAIAKSSSPKDWKVDNDNAEMQFAANLPNAAIVLTKNPKFSVQGSWPGYKVNLKLPKDAKTAKKNEMLRIDNQEISGSGADKDNLPGSDGALGSAYNSKNESGSARFESDLEENVAYEGSSSSSGDEGEQDGIRTTLKRSKVAHLQNIVSSHQKPTLNNEDNDDIFLNKVKTAVQKLKRFDFNDPKTRKSLKDIIVHAKRVVLEAKTVLRDVASVVRSVQDFVSGNYDNADDDEEPTLPDENTSLEENATKAREDAEKAARKADFAAQRAQAASKMAVQIADDFWKVAQKSKALSKLRDAVAPPKGNARTAKKLDTHHTGMTSNKNNKLSNTVKQTKKETENIITDKKQNNDKAKKLETKEENQNQTTKEKDSRFETKILTQQRFGLHTKQSSYKEEPTNAIEAIGLQNDEDIAHLEEQSKYNNDLINKGKPQNSTNNKQNRLVLQATGIAKKQADLAKEMSSIVKLKVKKLRQLKSKMKENREVKKLTSYEKKALETPKDLNEVVKDPNNQANGKQRLSENKLNGNVQEKLPKQGKVTTNEKADGKTHNNDDINNADESESGSSSGSYDVELEVEPDKLEFAKGMGKMRERKIRIKNTLPDGRIKKISPITFSKILKAIRKVEGILGFTIEKEGESKKRVKATKKRT